MTERTAIILKRLGDAGTATIPEMIEWMDCDRRAGTLTLGIMCRAGQIHRVGWTKCPDKLSLWSLV